jgi:hypothetical protein
MFAVESMSLNNLKHSQHIVTVPRIFQVLQVNQAGQMLHSSGQQIMVHAVPQGAQTIQLATQSGQALQQIQVVPVSGLQVRELLLSLALVSGYGLTMQMAVS